MIDREGATTKNNFLKLIFSSQNVLKLNFLCFCFRRFLNHKVSEIPPDFSDVLVYSAPAQASTDNPTPAPIPPRP